MPEEWEAYHNSHHLPHIVIVDIDGTMALNDGHRDWYDLTKVSGDRPNWSVVNLVKDLIHHGDIVRFISGREGTEQCWSDTLAWLSRYMPQGYDSRWSLTLRDAGDHRKDDLVKYEIFNHAIRNRYHVRFVLDDRDSVVKMWRALGLACFQVADGDF